METNMSDIEIQKMISEINKNQAEELLTIKKARWYEIVVIAGAVTALLAAGKYLL